MAVNFGSGSSLAHLYTPAFLHSECPCCAGWPGQGVCVDSLQGEKQVTLGDTMAFDFSPEPCSVSIIL